jgi:hypothetical protein
MLSRARIQQFAQIYSLWVHDKRPNDYRTYGLRMRIVEPAMVSLHCRRDDESSLRGRMSATAEIPVQLPLDCLKERPVRSPCTEQVVGDQATSGAAPNSNGPPSLDKDLSSECLGMTRTCRRLTAQRRAVLAHHLARYLPQRPLIRWQQCVAVHGL